MEELEEYTTFDRHTREKVRYIKRKCICGRSLYFLENRPTICFDCGRLVYPTKKIEFKEKLKKELRRK